MWWRARTIILCHVASEVGKAVAVVNLKTNGMWIELSARSPVD